VVERRDRSLFPADCVDSNSTLVIVRHLAEGTPWGTDGFSLRDGGLSAKQQTSGEPGMADGTTTVAELRANMRRFAAERNWDPFHTPKNLTLCLASEVGELCEIFRWLTPEESTAASADPVKREAIADELADVMNVLVLLCEHTDIDLSEAVAHKMIKNAVKYPAP
jgi:NTP pyrophosphatase (non-canonical NTP hydrolase)